MGRGMNKGSVTDADVGPSTASATFITLPALASGYHYELRKLTGVVQVGATAGLAQVTIGIGNTVYACSAVLLAARLNPILIDIQGMIFDTADVIIVRIFNGDLAATAVIDGGKLFLDYTVEE